MNFIKSILPSLNRKLVYWDSNKQKVANHGLLTQIKHRLINLSKPGHYEKMLRESIKTAYLMRHNSGEGNVTFNQTPLADVAEQVTNVMMNSRKINARTVAVTMRDFDDAVTTESRRAKEISPEVHEAIDDNLPSNLSNEEIKSESSDLTAEKEIKLDRETLKEVQQLESEIERDTEAIRKAGQKFKGVEELQAKVGIDSIRMRQKLADEIGAITLEKNKIMDDYDKLYVERGELESPNPPPKYADAKIRKQQMTKISKQLKHLDNELNRLEVQLRAKLAKIDASYDQPSSPPKGKH